MQSKEQMLLAMKDEARGNLNEEENDNMLDNAYGNDTSEELNVAVIMMARMQPADDKADAEPKYVVDTISEVKTLEKKPVQSLIYKEAYEALERELSVEKDTIEKLEKEKDNIQGEFFQLENENVKIRYEIELSKKAFKTRENKYLDDIVDLEEKLNSHDRIVYKLGQSIQTIHMLGKKPNKVYDPFLKAGLGYQNQEHLKKAITSQPKMHDGERLQSTKLIIDSPDSEKTLEDVEESRLKMKDKMIQLDYEKLNALYEIFVPKTERPIEQTYF
ncbi:hypothetical protein Tco_0018698 [Tanacetum coccineum]